MKALYIASTGMAAQERKTVRQPATKLPHLQKKKLKQAPPRSPRKGKR